MPFFSFLPMLRIKMKITSTRKSRSICVFYGAFPGKDEEYLKAANHLGRVLAERKIHLVYGGGSVGLMGGVASTASLGGSQVLGIILGPLKFVSGGTIGEELVVKNLQERLLQMLFNADAFIALPGGFGTLGEVFQIASMAQLNLHQKPIGLLNVNNFFTSLIAFVDYAVQKNFISRVAQRIIISATTAEELLDKMQAFVRSTSG